MFSNTYQRAEVKARTGIEICCPDWNAICFSFWAKEADMNGIIKIVSGLVIGLAGFHQIAQHPVQGISALFLAGFLVMIGFEKRLAERSREIKN